MKVSTPVSEKNEADIIKITDSETSSATTTVTSSVASNKHEQFYDEDSISAPPSTNRMIGGSVVSGGSYADLFAAASPVRRRRSLTLVGSYEEEEEEEDDDDDAYPPPTDEKRLDSYRLRTISTPIKQNSVDIVNVAPSDEKKSIPGSRTVILSTNADLANSDSQYQEFLHDDTTDEGTAGSLSIGMLQDDIFNDDHDYMDEDHSARALFKAVQQQRSMDEAAFERNIAVDESVFERRRSTGGTTITTSVDRRLSTEDKNIIPDFNALRSFPDIHNTRASWKQQQEEQQYQENIGQMNGSITTRTPSPYDDATTTSSSTGSDETYRTMNNNHMKQQRRSSIEFNNAFASSSSSESSFFSQETRRAISRQLSGASSSAPSEHSNIPLVGSKPRAFQSKFFQRKERSNKKNKNTDGVFKDTKTPASCFNMMNRRMRCYALILGLLVVCGSIMITIGIMTGEIGGAETTAASLFSGIRGKSSKQQHQDNTAADMRSSPGNDNIAQVGSYHTSDKYIKEEKTESKEKNSSADKIDNSGNNDNDGTVVAVKVEDASSSSDNIAQVGSYHASDAYKKGGE